MHKDRDGQGRGTTECGHAVGRARGAGEWTGSRGRQRRWGPWWEDWGPEWGGPPIEVGAGGCAEATYVQPCSARWSRVRATVTRSSDGSRRRAVGCGGRALVRSTRRCSSSRTKVSCVRGARWKARLRAHRCRSGPRPLSEPSATRNTPWEPGAGEESGLHEGSRGCARRVSASGRLCGLSSWRCGKPRGVATLRRLEKALRGASEGEQGPLPASSPRTSGGRSQVALGTSHAIACTPPSTWTISPVVIGNQSDSNATHARATGSLSVTSHPEAHGRAQVSSNALKLGIDFAAIVRTGPAATR